MTAHGFKSVLTGAVALALSLHMAPAMAASSTATADTDMIVNGKPAEDHKWPWQIRLFYTDTDAKGGCGGSIISKQWILTAAHCVVFEDAGQVQFLTKGWIGYGSNKLDQLKKVETAAIIPHAEYNPSTHANDIALIKLSEPVEYGDGIGPADLGTEDLYKKLQGTKATVTGWGYTYDIDKFKRNYPGVDVDENVLAPNDLQEVDVPIQDLEKCRANYAELGGIQVPDGQLCAGLKVGGKDSCQGDSGGPLVSRDPSSKKGYRQIGIVSWGIGCAEAKLFGVYTRTDYYLDWIQNTISAN
jgi:secreted trypsin-like serine protease